MKNLHLILILLIVSNLSAQFDYYYFQTIGLSNARPYSGNCDITPYSNGVYYSNNLGKITRGVFSTSWTWQDINSTSVKTGSRMTFAENKLYYFDASGKLRNLYYTTSWQDFILNNSAPVSSGTGLVSAANSTLFYTSATSNSIIRIYWTGTSWAFQNLNIYCTSGSNLLYVDQKVIFVHTDGKLHNLIKNPSNGNWYDGGVMSSAAPLPRSNTPLIGGTTGVLYYVNTDKNIVKLFFQSGAWQYEVVDLYDVPVESNCNVYYKSNNELYYYSNNHSIYALLYDRCNYITKKLVAANNIVGSGAKIAAFQNDVIYPDATNNSYIKKLATAITPSSHNYIYLKSRSFYNKTSLFTPITLNYGIDVNSIDENGVNSFFLTPHHSYSPDNARCCDNWAQAKVRFVTHFKQIQSLGFNTLRIVGAVPSDSAKRDANTPYPGDELWYRYQFGPSNNHSQRHINFNSFNWALKNRVVNMTDTIIKLAKDSASLRVILLTGSPNLANTSQCSKYNTYLSELASVLNTSQGLLAYDLYNEPGSNIAADNKAANCQTFNSFYSSIRVNDNNHPITIGLHGPTDMERFDPALMSLDFHSFHFYPFENTGAPYNLVRSFFKWVRLHIRKAWMVGEIGYSAKDTRQNESCNGSSGGWSTEAFQAQYVDTTMKLTFGVGGCGYSWWWYHDVFHGSQEDFYGLYTRCNDKKPTADHFSVNPNNFSCSLQSDPFPNGTNEYYRRSNSAFKVIGYLKDNANKPIKNGYLIGFQTGWTNSNWTITDENGYFEFWSAAPWWIVRVTALGREKFEYNITYTNGVANLGTITLGLINCTLVPRSKADNYLKLDDGASIKIIPNPAQQEFYIEMDQLLIEKLRKISIYSIYGSETGLNYQLSENRLLFNSNPKLLKGTYLVKIELGDQSYVKKLIIL